MSSLRDAIRVAIEDVEDALSEAEEDAAESGSMEVSGPIGDALESLTEALRATGEKA